MINFSPLYTGENSAVKLPELDSLERASQRKNELAIRAEEKKLDKALKDKDYFRKLMDIDPVAARSVKNASKQAQLLEEYNNFATQKYMASKGNLSMSDELEIMAKKQFLQASQQKILADEKRLADAEALIERDVRGYYDKNKFSKIREEYSTKKDYELPSVLLDVKPQDIASALSANKTVGTPAKDIIDISEEKDPTGKATYWQAQYPVLRNEEEGRALLVNTAFDNEAYMKDLIQKFSRASDADKYLMDYDSNKNGKVDPAERTEAFAGIDENHPVFQWAWDQPLIRKAAMGAQKPTQARQVKDKTGAGMGPNALWASLKIGSGTAIPYQPSERQTTVWGSKEYDTYHAVTEFPIQNIPTTNVEVRKDKGNLVKPTAKTMALRLTGYDENEDEFTFIAESNYREDNTEGRGDQVAIKRDQMPKGFDNFEILVNGNKVKISNLKRETQPAAAAPQPKKKLY